MALKNLLMPVGVFEGCRLNPYKISIALQILGPLVRRSPPFSVLNGLFPNSLYGVLATRILALRTYI